MNDLFPEEDEESKPKRQPVSVMSIVLKDTTLLGMYGGAAVCTVIALALLAATGNRVLEQNALLAARTEFSTLTLCDSKQRKGVRSENIRKFEKLSRSRPGDLGLNLVLAGNYLRAEEFDKAEKLYTTLSQLPSQPADAFLGLACCALERAVREKARQAAHLQTAREVLEKVAGPQANFEAQLLLGAAWIIEGRPDRARRSFDELKVTLEGMRDGLPSRENVAAYYWNRALSQVLSGDIDALSTLQQAMQFRPQWEDATRVLIVAIRSAMDRESLKLEEIKDLQNRLLPILNANYSSKGERGSRNRYGLRAEDRALIFNAIGLALYKRGDFAGALNSFKESQRYDSGQLAFRLNESEAMRALAASEKDPKVAEKLWFDFATELSREARNVSDRELRHKMLVNAAVGRLRGGKPELVPQVLEQARDLAIDPAEVFRLLGIANLQRKDKKRAAEEFRKAIDAGHPDSTDLELLIQSMAE